MSPILHLRVSKRTYQGVVDRVLQRVTSWQAHHLSLAGRITLVQAVLSLIPMYTIQSTRIPTTKLNHIKSIYGKFLWGATNDRNKFSLIAWRKVCQPEANGGLRLRKMEECNLAFLIKLCWSLILEENKT